MQFQLLLLQLARLAQDLLKRIFLLQDLVPVVPSTPWSPNRLFGWRRPATTAGSADASSDPPASKTSESPDKAGGEGVKWKKARKRVKAILFVRQRHIPYLTYLVFKP